MVDLSKVEKKHRAETIHFSIDQAMTEHALQDKEQISCKKGSL
jgi:hypothetical protein